MQAKKFKSRDSVVPRYVKIPNQKSVTDTSNWEERSFDASTTSVKGRIERRSLMLWLTAGEVALASSGILNPRIKYHGSSKNM